MVIGKLKWGQNILRKQFLIAIAYGPFQFRMMPFGLCNALSTFQMLHWTTCLVYLDNIIFSRTVEEHLSQLKEVFERLRQAKYED